MQTHTLPVTIPSVDVKYDADRAVPKHMPKLFWLALFCGSTGSGKTHALVECVQMYDKARSFDKCILISSSNKNDPKYAIFEKLHCQLQVYDKFTSTLWADVEQGIKSDIEEYQEYLKALAVWHKTQKEGNTRDVTQYEYNLLEAAKFKKPTTPWKRGPPTTLILLDDCVGNKDLYRSDGKSDFMTFCLMHRHWKCCITFLTQTYHNAVPRSLRPNLKFLILFGNKNLGMCKEIALEYSTFINAEEFMEYWQAATKEKHKFFYVDFSAPKGEQLRIGWDKAFNVAEEGNNDDNTAQQPQGDIPYAIRTPNASDAQRGTVPDKPK